MSKRGRAFLKTISVGSRFHKQTVVCFANSQRIAGEEVHR